MAERTDLLVIGAGPYAYSAAAYARDRGIDTQVVGLPMSFWREQMPTDMYLRSGPDWYLDAAGEHTFAAYFEDRGLSRAEHDPIPIGVFLDHTDWFAEQQGLRRRRAAGRRAVEADDTARSWPRWRTATTITADKVLAAPGIRALRSACRPGTSGVPERPARRTPSTSSTSTTLAGARVASSAAGRARTSGRPCSATTAPPGRRRAPAPGTGLRAGQLGVRGPATSSRPSPSAAGGARCLDDRQRRSRWSSGRSAGSPSSPG